ncbi:MAG: hypothetical protein KJ906_01415 [Nanoarchaeota archaeon]|nr:hypothetical protein [Nanoarchaeota archaeon]
MGIKINEKQYDFAQIDLETDSEKRGLPIPAEYLEESSILTQMLYGMKPLSSSESPAKPGAIRLFGETGILAYQMILKDLTKDAPLKKIIEEIEEKISAIEPGCESPWTLWAGEYGFEHKNDYKRGI